MLVIRCRFCDRKETFAQLRGQVHVGELRGASYRLWMFWFMRPCPCEIVSDKVGQTFVPLGPWILK